MNPIVGSNPVQAPTAAASAQCRPYDDWRRSIGGGKMGGTPQSVVRKRGSFGFILVRCKNFHIARKVDIVAASLCVF